MRRLSRAGFKKEFVRLAILPEWWDESCEQDAALLPEIEVRVARFLGLSVSMVRDPEVALATPVYAGTRLRRVHDVDRDRLAPAIHSAMQVASAVVRSLRTPGSGISIPPEDGLIWRQHIEHAGAAIKLDDVLRSVWGRGIPVIALDQLPAPSFQGLACIVEQRPVVVLGHRHDEPGKAAFIVAHEVGHIAAGDCSPDHPVVDEEEEVEEDANMERRADRYATHVLIGSDDAPFVDADNHRDLATKSSQLERSSGVDAGAIIYAWARRTGDYAKASMAVKALYRASGARRALSKHFDLNVDLESASESDRSLLHCVLGDSDRDAAAH